MKKFFTLFALLSVGLSAWAQTYKLELREKDDNEEDFVYFSYAMKEGTNGIYTLDKYVYLDEPEYCEWYNGNDWVLGYKPINYRFVVTKNDAIVSELPYTIEDVERGGWYLFYFRYTPERGLYYDEDISEGPLFDINLTDDLSIAIGESYEAELEGVSIKYTRSGCNQWGTICLPFNCLTDIQDNVTFYYLEGVAEGAMIFTPFDEGEELWAGDPAIFKLNQGDKLEVTDFQVSPNLTDDTNDFTLDDGWSMHGTFETVYSGDNTYYFIANHDNGEGVYYGKNITIPPYRAWFTAPDGYDGAPLRISIDDTEGLQFVEQEDGTVKVYYDLQGRKLDEAQKGLKIENGKVIMVK